MEQKDLFLYIDSTGRKVKSAGLTLNQYATNGVFHLITVGRFDNVTATFRYPSGNLSAKYHLILAGRYQLTEDDTEPILKENATNLWEYKLDPIAKRVTSIDIAGTTARLSVSFTGCSYDSHTQILQENMVASTQIVVNKADQSVEYDESYNAEDVDNLWSVVNERIASSSIDEQRLEELEDEVSGYSEDIAQNTSDIQNLNNNVIPGMRTDINSKVSKSGDTMSGNLGLVSASMLNGNMMITAEGTNTPQISFGNATGNHKITISGEGDGIYPSRPNVESLGKNGNTWKDVYVAGNLSNTVKTVSVAQIVDTNTTQTISGKKTFLTVPELSSERTISGDNAIVDAKYVNDTITSSIGDFSNLSADVAAIESKIPAEASSSNKLADKAFVNSSINSSAAYFRGTFADQLALLSAQWQIANPSDEYYCSNNDYAYVESIVHGADIGDWDPDDHIGEAWRFICVVSNDTISWQPQFMVNQTAFTQAQLDAINSGITSTILAGLAEKSEIPTKTSDLTNDSGFITDANVVFDNNASTITGKKTFTSGLNVGDYESNVDSNGFHFGVIYSNTLSGLDINSLTQVIKPTSDDDWTLGASDKRFKDIYIAGKLNDGTHEFTLPSATGTLALTSELPTKTSDLTNDSGYITVSNIPANTSAFNNDGDGQGSPYATVSQIPTNNNQLTNGAGYITGISSSDVSTALGYTPLGSSDLNGYATEQYVNIAIANIPQKLTTSELCGKYTVHSSDDISGHQQNVLYIYQDGTFKLTTGPGNWDGNGSWILSNNVITLSNYSNPNVAPVINGATLAITLDSATSRPILTGTNPAPDAQYWLGAYINTDNTFYNKDQLYTKTESDNKFATIASVPTATSDLTNDSGYITSANIPTATSDLTNDSGFITSSDLQPYVLQTNLAAVATTGAYSDLSGTPTLATVATSGNYNDLSNKPAVPTKVSDLSNDSNFQTQSQVSSSIQTALNGYATETYVNNAIDGLGTVFDLKGSVATVNDLPASGNEIGDVYYVESTQSGYIWIEDATTNIPRWEQLGETIDLSNYTQFTDLTWNNILNKPTFATVATTGSYNDLLDKPTIPAAQIQADWNQTNSSALDYIKNKPSIPNAQVVLTEDMVGKYVKHYSDQDSSHQYIEVYLYQSGEFKLVHGQSANYTGSGSWRVKDNVMYVYDFISSTADANVQYVMNNSVWDVTLSQRVANSPDTRVLITARGVEIPGAGMTIDLGSYINDDTVYLDRNQIDGIVDDLPEVFNVNNLVGLYNQNDNTTPYNHSGYTLQIYQRPDKSEKIERHAYELKVFDNNGTVVWYAENMLQVRPFDTTVPPADTNWISLGTLFTNDYNSVEENFQIFKGTTMHTWTDAGETTWTQPTAEVYILKHVTYGEFYFYSVPKIETYTAGSGISIVDNVISSDTSHVFTYLELVGHWTADNSNGIYIDVNSDGSFTVFFPAGIFGLPSDTFATGDLTLSSPVLTLSNTQPAALASYLDGAQFTLTVDSVGMFHMTHTQFGSYTLQIPDYALQSELPTKVSDLQNDTGFITSSALSGYAQSSDLATVATTGSYNDLLNKPTIPTDTGDLTNNAGYITISSVPTDNNQLTNGAGYITSAALSPYALSSNVPSIPTTSTADKIVLTTTTEGTYKTSTNTVGTAAYADTTTSITSGGTGLPTSGTVYTALAAKQDVSTAYNTSNIVYSATEPSAPVVGMLWLSPVQ